MEVTLAEVKLRHLDVLAEGQGGHSQPPPRAAGVKEEANSVARADESVHGRADAADSMEGIAESQDETERKARIFAESVVNIRLAFHVDGESGDVTIKVIDNVTGEVVRYIPPEELTAAVQKLEEFAGLVVDKRR